MHSGNTALLDYLANVCRVFSARGWTDKLIAYPVDEPNTTSAERAADNLARTLHKASARAGFRAKFLLTDDPRPTRLTTHAANTFLFNDVDIWCVRYYYFFGRVPVLRKLQAKGAQVWWYPYYNSSVAQLPNFVIDKGLADERVWGWLMYQWKVDGMLYWGITRWGNALTGKGDRDPYKNPLSFEYSDGRVANGEASLIYPGYYPRYGLDDKSAPPVSSLRLEALRDGFQDLEYLRIAAKTPGITPAAISAVVKSVTWYPYPIKYGHIFKFPKYVKSSFGLRLRSRPHRRHDRGGAGRRARKRLRFVERRDPRPPAARRSRDRRRGPRARGRPRQNVAAAAAGALSCQCGPLGARLPARSQGTNRPA